MSGFDSVGTLLADVANNLLEGLRIFSLADKTHWRQDEYEHVQALEAALNDAKKDFQELCPLVNGQSQYEHDRTYETIQELRLLRDKFRAHVQLLRDWSRSGGPINPVWVRETHSLQRQLHRAQCRAARRVFASSQESSQRCLGAFLVRRAQAKVAVRPDQQTPEADCQKRQLEELAACTRTGSFDRFRDEDMVFICDFCDGHLIWEDLENVPTQRTAAFQPRWPGHSQHWQATGTSSSGPQEKQVVFPPIAVANHLAPLRGDWQARLLCPLCEDEAKKPQDEDDDEELYKPDDEFEDVASLQNHMEWQHAEAVANDQRSSNCAIM
ncbi:uncharacterized protein MAM_06538 [Metarhizium album ARSEF 1941]|uniref:Uncharacterized protein n=1 Tax=Metarhizium album (strain ARSEF 1941) TaxID=1081103 RepID=A0A0B2WQC5_METAS|nr:uncharacterized protein MAM_06538 [Metarhizium album ARSEF 1941]KHN95697.1 hypothetical protein MAM_06538 [Metarhizium album ARSEF 1941]